MRGGFILTESSGGDYRFIGVERKGCRTMRSCDAADGWPPETGKRNGMSPKAATQFPVSYAQLSWGWVPEYPSRG